MLHPRTRALRAGLALLTLLSAASSRRAAAQQAPSGPHPRLWLDATTLAGLKARGVMSVNQVNNDLEVATKP